MADLQTLDEMLSDVQRILRRMWTLVATSSLMTTLLVASNWGKLTPQLLAVLEVCGIIAGIAGIAAPFLDSHRHPTDASSSPLNYRPFLLGPRIVIRLLCSAGALYGFYYFANGGNELCIVFLALGSYLLFSAVTLTIIAVRREAERRQVWEHDARRTATVARRLS